MQLDKRNEWSHYDGYNHDNNRLETRRLRWHQQRRRHGQWHCYCRMIVSLLVPLVHLTVLISNTCAEQEGGDSSDLEVGQFVVIDVQQCYADLVVADGDEDGQINEEEYVRLVSEQTGGLVNVTTFDELPTEFKVSYAQTACFCQNPIYGGNASDTGCCVGDQASIAIPEDPDQGPSQSDQAYLNSACSLVQGAASDITAEPTMSPTDEPSSSPVTMSPTTTLPTDVPSDTPRTAQPTDGPTTTPPTLAPTTTPTESPTEPPITVSPAPTTATGAPTVPTEAPTDIPTTNAPTGSPVRRTEAPVPRPRGGNASVEYRIAVRSGKTMDKDEQDEYLLELSNAVDVLANQVAQEVETPSNPSLLRDLAVAPLRQRGGASFGTSLGRNLEINPQTSDFEGVIDINCPPDFTDDDLCQEVESVVPLEIIDEPENDNVVVSKFQAALDAAIQEGRLRGFLADTSVIVLLDVEPSVAPSSSSSLGTGAIAGIFMGALVVILCTATLVLVSQGVNDETKPDYEGFQPEVPDQEDPSILPAQSEDMSLYTDVNADAAPSMLGATRPGYREQVEPATRRDLEAIEAGEDKIADAGVTEPDGSSNAGSSGWSSSVGASSSLNTGSMDESIEASAPLKPSLATFSAASNMVGSLDQTVPKSDDTEGVPGVPAVSRDQLDSLIEAGDWAAVGATAALLAAASDSQSASSRSRGTSRSRDSSSIDAARAAELDNLVDQGDWEGVVLAAAKFQASSESAGDTRTGGSLDSIDSLTGTGTGTGTAGSPSASTSLSESPSKAQKAAEIRAEVEALVRRVVPDEIDNVDEMLNQFKGREEELVETLRTMQERAVAQKARTSSQKEAKYKARQAAKLSRGVVPGAGNVAERAAQSTDSEDDGKSAVPAATEADAPPSTASKMTAKSALAKELPPPSRSGSSSERSETTTGSKVRSALELAIEAGDWEAVGEAAAMMSDVSVHSVSTNEVDRLADASISRASSASRSVSSRSRKSLEGVNAARAAQLDSLIDQGDWSAVVSAANRFSETDKKSEPGKASQEEEDALKQAELWMKIADQKKAEGATDVGASDAAEWAIQRSLIQMKEEDKRKSRKSDSSYDEDEV